MVLLVREPVALQSTGHYPGEFVPIEVLLSNFTFAGTPPWHGRPAEIIWTAGIDGRLLGNGTVDANGVTIAQGSIGSIAVFGVDIPEEVVDATTISVTVQLHLGGVAVAANQWELAVFPRRVAAADTECTVPVFSDSSLLAAARRVCPNATASAPELLAGQTTPFVLLRHGGMPDAATAAALSRAGGFAVLLSPTEAGSWPVCSGSSSSAVIPPTVVPLAQPWWLSNECFPKEQSWMTGTLVYNTSLTRTLGQAVVDEGFLAYNYGKVMNESLVYTLDTLSPAIAASVHVRAIPSDGVYAGSGYETMVANNALIWEGRVPGAGAGRFLVSGLNLFDGPKLRADPTAEFAFERLLSYAVAEAAVVSTPLLRTATSTHTRGCNVSGSFCAVGSQQPCQQLSTGSTESLCNANFEIAVPACLQHGNTLDSLYIQVKVKTAGTKLIGFVYDTAADAPADGGNHSLCAASPNSTGNAPPPRRLVAKGTPVTVTTLSTAWIRLPLPPTPLASGVYWIGVIANYDLQCLSGTPAATPPTIGPGALDAYVSQSFSAGPGLGPGLRWTTGSAGLSVYATVAPNPHSRS